MIVSALIFLLGVLVSSISQVFLKKEASKPHDTLISEYLNFPVIFAYVLFFGATLLSIIAYRVIPLSYGAILDSTSYIFVFIFGFIFFKERITLRKILALGIICLGIFVYSIGI